MNKVNLPLLAALTILACSASGDVWARGNLVITFPRRSKLTSVQRLNREGVEAVKRHHYEKAEALFYKAYLYDPGDPFTLNNLGYASELQGQLDRAHKFYALASEQGGNATIDKTNSKRLEGMPIRYAFDSLRDVPMRMNRMNADAMQLLSEDRAFQAAALLKEALTLDQENPFTLNNLGVADEATGEYEQALQYYRLVAHSHSSEPVVVTLNQSWRGRPVSDMAAESARRLEQRLQKMDPGRVNAILFTVRGVAASNENNWIAARQDFLQAFALDPESGFSLNNRGYVAERDGDLETAHFFYYKAQKASDAKARVGLATERSAEGKSLFSVAGGSNQKVDIELDRFGQERRRQTGPIELIPRDNTPASDSAQPTSEIPSAVSPSSVKSPPHWFK